MKKLLIAVLALGMMFGAVNVGAGEVTEAVVGAAKAIETGVEQVSGAVASTISSDTVQETVVPLSGTLDDALRGMISSAVTAKNFLVGQVPEVVTQLLWWHGVKSAIALLFVFLFIFIAPYLIWRGCKKIEPNHNKWDDLCGVMIFGNFICLCVAARILSVASVLDWLKILVAPKLYLIEYAAELIK